MNLVHKIKLIRSLCDYYSVCKFIFKIPSTQSKEKNIITWIHNFPRISKSNHSRETQLFMSWISVRWWVNIKRKCEIAHCEYPTNTTTVTQISCSALYYNWSFTLNMGKYPIQDDKFFQIFTYSHAKLM